MKRKKPSLEQEIKDELKAMGDGLERLRKEMDPMPADRLTKAMAQVRKTWSGRPVEPKAEQRGFDSGRSTVERLAKRSDKLRLPSEDGWKAWIETLPMEYRERGKEAFDLFSRAVQTRLILRQTVELQRQLSDLGKTRESEAIREQILELSEAINSLDRGYDSVANPLFREFGKPKFD